MTEHPNLSESITSMFKV